MNIIFDVEGQQINANLEDSQAAHAFANLLPLSVELSDFGGGVEKVADLPKPLPTSDSPTGMQPVTGDITYYAPWGNLAIFRQGFSHARGLIKLGSFQDDFSAIDRPGSFIVKIYLAE